MQETAAPLLGLIGKKRSGKDTLAATLVDELGYTRVALADPLKEAALALDPIILDDLIDGEVRLSAVVALVGWERAKEDYPEVRRTLQALGVAIRGLDPDFWLNIALDRIREIDGPVVVTDVRFPNEAEAIVEEGGDIVRILRPDLVSTDTHESETALDDYPEMATVLNDGTREELATSARFVHNFAATSF